MDNKQLRKQFLCVAEDYFTDGNVSGYPVPDQDIKGRWHLMNGTNDSTIVKSETIKRAYGNVSSWIPVTERMPEELIPVLVYIPDQEHINTAIYERKEGWYETYESTVILSQVTHWMPLAEPPKTDKP
jgi:hypothetical protein